MGKYLETYKNFEELLKDVRERHNGAESEEEDRTLEIMDWLWLMMLPEERSQIKSHLRSDVRN